ncbi:hypothetical protein F4703DRAFT_1878883 [Phycomyces blakesleeanus]
MLCNVCEIFWIFFLYKYILFGCLLLGYLVTWLLGYLVTWLLGCLVTWLLSCLVTWLLGCLRIRPRLYNQPISMHLKSSGIQLVPVLFKKKKNNKIYIYSYLRQKERLLY